ncbi:MAG: hypothetical protein JXA13_13340 [Anaerolineales bacterium]|nr:hypothetical protein [Anaerolineales bacterium]
MNEESIKAHIFKRLSRNHNPDDIIFELCDRANMSWPEAKKLVHMVQHEQGNAITRRQSPLLIMIGLVVFAGGAYLLVASGGLIFELVSQFNITESDPIQNLGPLAYLAYYAPYAIPKAVTGLAMIIGSMVGMKDVWVAIFGD